MKIRFITLALMVSLGLATPSHPAGDPQPSASPAAGEGDYAMGTEKVREGKWKEAAALFGKVVAKDARHYKALNMLGYSLRKMGSAEEAIAAYDKALRIKPDYAPALEYRGVAHVMAGDRDAAMADFQRLKALGSPLAEDLQRKIMAMPKN